MTKILRCQKCGRIRIHGNWTPIDGLSPRLRQDYTEAKQSGKIKEVYFKCPRCRESSQ